MASDSKKAGNAAEIDRLALVFAKEPGSKAFIPLAEEYGKAGMWEEAAAVLEEGLKTYPGFITAMVALGRAYEQMNQAVKAKAILEEAIKLSPDNLRAHRTLAKLYTAQGAKDAAIRSCDVILAVNPQDQEALSLRAGLDVPAVPVAAPAQGQPHGKPVEPASPESDHFSEKAGMSNWGGTEESAASTASTTTTMTRKPKSTVVMQLERWLSSVQARRRDTQPPSRPSSITSFWLQRFDRLKGGC